MSVLLLVLWAVTAAQAGDRIIGLLTLPEVFGEGACDKFTPLPITLYAAPDGKSAVGAIRVDKHWTFHDAGGCDGLTVAARHDARGTVGELPTREYEYEAPAAIVLEQRGRWFKVQLTDGAAWLQASARDEYYPIERLVKDRLTSFTDAFAGPLASSPGGAPVAGLRETLAPGADVRVVASRRRGDDLWFEIEVLNHSVCASIEEPRVIARGWVPAHAASGAPTIWFASRGC